MEKTGERLRQLIRSIVFWFVRTRNRVQLRLLQGAQITRVQTVGWLGLRVDVVLDTLQTLVLKGDNFGIDFPVASFPHMTEYPCPVSTIPE